MSYFRTAILLAGLTALFMGVGYPDRRRDRRDDRAGGRGRHEPVHLLESDRMVLSMYGAQEVDRAPRPSSTTSSPSWPAAPDCRCRACS